MQGLLPSHIDYEAMLTIAVIIAILVLPLAFVADSQLGDAGLGYFGNYFVIYIGAYVGIATAAYLGIDVADRDNYPAIIASAAGGALVLLLAGAFAKR